MNFSKINTWLLISRETINVKRSYPNSIFFNQFIKDQEWTLSMDMSREPMDSADNILSSLPGLCPGYQWTVTILSTESMDNVHGHCPGRQWRMSTESMDIDQSEWAPWTLSRGSMDIVQYYYLFHGKCPGSLLTLSRETMDSVDILQIGQVKKTKNKDKFSCN